MAENETTEETTPEAGEAESPAAQAAEAVDEGVETTEEVVETTAGAAATDTAPARRSGRKVRVGTVTSDKSDKTVTVTVERQMAHPLYGKQVGRRKKVHAHDEDNEYRIGDIVRITETRPLSKTKRWRVLELIERPE